MKVLVACEESQEVCKAFRAHGHEAYSCDIQKPSGGHPEWHILGDALMALRGGQIVTMDGVGHEVGKWDLLIAHPPCTYLSNAGARHLWKGHELQADRVMLGIQGRDLFMRFWWADIPKICVENPVPSRVFCLPEYTQSIQPYQFGHPYTKKNVSLAQRPAVFDSYRHCRADCNMVPIRFLQSQARYAAQGDVYSRPGKKKTEPKPFPALQKQWPSNGGKVLRWRSELKK